MAYRVIHGKFHLFYKRTMHVGSEPDGDSMWFKPNDPSLLADLGGRSADFNKGGFSQTRFEGIDSLELHYKGSHQHDALSRSARDTMLDNAGFDAGGIVYSGSHAARVRSATPHPVPGYILSRNIDPFGRPVCFLFAGTPAEADGDTLHLTPARMNQSLNAKVLNAGHAYPAYYTGLPTDLRTRITALADDAWAWDRGMWAADKTMSGFKATSLANLEALAIWPKLFRRLAGFFKEGNTDLTDFDAWLRADTGRDDDIWIISRGEKANMHDVVTTNSTGKMRMRFWPEDLIVEPR